MYRYKMYHIMYHTILTTMVGFKKFQKNYHAYSLFLLHSVFNCTSQLFPMHQSFINFNNDNKFNLLFYVHASHVSYSITVIDDYAIEMMTTMEFLVKRFHIYRIGIDEWLRVPSVQDVYAIGDCSGFLESTGKPVLPALAQVNFDCTDISI